MTSLALANSCFLIPIHMATKQPVQPRPSLSNIRVAIEEDKTPPLSDKRRVLRNLLVLSMSFLLLFTAYQSLQNLQSSINAEGGLGTVSLATAYTALVTSCMFLPSYMICRLGLKYTMVSAISSFILGVGGAPLWTAKCSYLTAQAHLYADLVGALDAAPFVTGFFGIFFMLFQTAQIWGNLTSYLVLRSSDSPDAVDTSNLRLCGSSFHPKADVKQLNSTKLGSVTSLQILTLSGLYACLGISAILIMVLFLDPISNELMETSPPLRYITETIDHMRNAYQLLIIPLTIYSGMQQAFLWGDFTQAFVGCSWGVQYIGFVMMAYGVMDSICSMLFGLLMRRVGRVSLVLTAAVLDLAMMVHMVLWKPMAEDLFNYFLIAILWGVADASWQTQINSFYSIVFTDTRNAAFANYRLWEAVGFIIMFSVQSVFRFSVKIAGLMIGLLIGIIGYLVIEFHSNTYRTPTLRGRY
ncbi:protein unc-93 homolog A-like isoform X2 [Ornithodoros turicata]|uniref:protein unc-93 homolog A-like isoform X2 n=1 Tax=Ornithodoros turicata TaxID=34597 RepID=UPI00313A3DBC